MTRIVLFCGIAAVLMVALLSAFCGQAATSQRPQTLSVRDLGATPDDATDDTVSIQRALDRGSRILLPKGRYIVTSLLLRRDGVTLYGEGVLQKRAGINGVLLRVTGSGNLVTGITLNSRATSTILGSENDALRIEGDHNRIESVRIAGSNGNGIRVEGAAGNKIVGNTVRDAQQNSILVSNAGANNTEIVGNSLFGTTAQNNIFVTADDGSRPTQARIRGTVIRDNICLDAFDTGIESGQNADFTLIAGNRVSGSRNPAILLRDGRNAVVRSNEVTSQGTGRAADHSGIAIVPLFVPASWQYGAVIESNRIDAPIARSGIYIGGSGVSVTNNEIVGRSRNQGYGITLAGRVSRIDIRGNRIAGVERGIDLNFDGRPHTRSHLTVSGNRVSDVSVPLNRFNVSAQMSSIEMPVQN